MAAARSSNRLYIFGDQIFQYEQHLSRLLQSTDIHLISFFRKCYAALRTELGRLSLHERDATPPISSIADLLTRKLNGDISSALEQALCLIHAFAAFIWHHSSDGKMSYPTAKDSQLLGFCTGALAAAAVSSSKNLDELVPKAVHAVVVALHVGLRSARMARSLDTDSEVRVNATRWSMLLRPRDDIKFTRERLEQILESSNAVSFNLRTGVAALDLTIFTQGKPSPARAYISATSAPAFTVSGPPEALARLMHEDDLAACSRMFLPIRGPYHAPHLFSDHDVEAVLSKARSYESDESAPSIPVISCGLGRAVCGSTSATIVRAAVQDVLTLPLSVDDVADHLVAFLRIMSPSKLLIVPIGTEITGAIPRRLLSSLAGQTAVTIRPAPIMPRGTEHDMNIRSKIAVVGMSGRFPGASNPEALWKLLQDKTDMCREVPELRWNVETHVDPAGKRKNTSRVRWGCWLDDPDLFDSNFFAISPREAPQVDPAQRLALMTAYEAIENAGIVPGRTPSTREDRVGVFYGVTSNDWCESNSGQDIDAYYIPGANRAFIPGRINYFFKFSGPSYAIDTACSSSLSAIHVACNSLWQKDCDMAIAGGTNVLTNPDMTTGLDKGHFLSTTGNCKTFDESADGYCRGEGVATVILKRLADAIEDGDPIHALIDGVYTNHSAEAESITRPHVGAQKAIFERVLNDSGTDPHEISYVEMHGTGTQAGDTREMTSVCSILAPTPHNGKTSARARDQPLHLGALKSNIGHGESVSGVSALIKVMTMMKKEMIPPHCGIKTRMNPAFPSDLGARNVHIDLTSTPWVRSRGQPRKAIINNFSAAGGNSSVLVEEPPMVESEGSDILKPQPVYPVAISARSARSLELNIRGILSHLSSPGVTLQHLSYTTTARRMHHQFRCVVVSDSIESLKGLLQQELDHGHGGRPSLPPKERLFAFTGQGSQYAGMGRELLESLTIFRDLIEHFDVLVRTQGYSSIMPIFSGSKEDDISAYSPSVVQLANVCMQIVLARIWISWGIMPTAVVGHSLGEYAALNIAGVISDSDTVHLVGRRAQHLEKICEQGTHAMLAVQATIDDLDRVLCGFEVACANAPKEIVLGGRVAEVATWKKKLADAGIRSTLLNTPYAFHCSQVEPIQAAFARDAETVSFQKPQIPVLSPLLGATVQEAGIFGPEYLARHAREPVQMMKCLQSASNTGIFGSSTYAIEFGPHPVVAGMIKATLGSSVTVLPTLRRNAHPWEVMVKSLCAFYKASMPVKWDGIFADDHSARKVLELPAYSWDLKSYWIPYRNDFTLTKGDIPVDIARSVTGSGNAWSNISRSKPKQSGDLPSPPLKSSTIHKVLVDETTSDGYHIVTECDTAREDVLPFIQGHKVDGFALCTPAVYADIAFSIGTHILRKFPHLPLGKIVTIANVEIKRALIGSADYKQLLRCSSKFDFAAEKAQLSFTVHDEHGKEIGELSSSELKFTAEADVQSLERILPTIKGHDERLRGECGKGTTCRISGPMSYRLVSQLAEFNPDYHCVDEVLYSHESYEAFCRVSFGQMKKGGTFHTSPAAIDGITQSAGFSMNANDQTNLNEVVFVNHGWDEFRLFETIRNDCQYSTYVRMTDTGNDRLWKGDVFCFTGDRIAAMAKGMKIQGVPRRLLRHILTQAAKDPRTKSKNKQAGAPVRRTQNAALLAAPVASPTEVSATTGHEDKLLKKDSTAGKAISIISEQSGVPESQLRDETRFEDIGIDSLLSLMITSQISEELGVETGSNFFLDNKTIADIKRVFGGPSVPTTAPSTAAADTGHVARPATGTEQTHVAKHALELSSVTVNERVLDTRFDDVLRIISEEVEVPLETLLDDTSLSSLGVDSLLALMIGSRLRDELDIDIDTSEMMISIDSIRALRETLFPSDTTLLDTIKDPSSSSERSFDMLSSKSASQPVTPPSPIGDEAIEHFAPSQKHDVPPTSSVILQGNTRTCTSTLWFFPDGSGLASSYVDLPRIREDLVVFGLNSPYLKKGLEMDCTWDEMVASYVTEVQRRQPHGPYSFAGWSAGGILGFRAAQILMSRGEVVRDLIIIDSPVPENLKPLPEHFFEYCKYSGLFGGKGPAPDWLIRHFQSINGVLSTYFANPLTVSTLRKVNILWACESSVDETFHRRPDDPPDMKFLTDKRTDFTAGGWTRLFGGLVPIEIELGVGQHHWNLLKGESAVKVAQYIKRVLE